MPVRMEEKDQPLPPPKALTPGCCLTYPPLVTPMTPARHLLYCLPSMRMPKTKAHVKMSAQFGLDQVCICIYACSLNHFWHPKPVTQLGHAYHPELSQTLSPENAYISLPHLRDRVTPFGPVHRPTLKSGANGEDLADL